MNFRKKYLYSGKWENVLLDAFLLANPDSDPYNPICVLSFHLSKSEMRFESKESTPLVDFLDSISIRIGILRSFIHFIGLDIYNYTQCLLGIHHGVQEWISIELHRYVLRCCLSLFWKEFESDWIMKEGIPLCNQFTKVWLIFFRAVLSLWPQIKLKKWLAKIPGV